MYEKIIFLLCLSFNMHGMILVSVSHLYWVACFFIIKGGGGRAEGLDSDFVVTFTRPCGLISHSVEE